MAEGDAKSNTFIVYQKFHEAVISGIKGDEKKAMKLFDEIFDEKLVFHPPTYAKTRDKKFTIAALAGAVRNFKNFRYVREFVSENDFVLEFHANVGTPDGPEFHGVDLVTVNPATKKITEFRVLAAPPKAVLRFGELQGEYLMSIGVLPKPPQKQSKM